MSIKNALTEVDAKNQGRLTALFDFYELDGYYYLLVGFNYKLTVYLTAVDFAPKVSKPETSLFKVHR